MRVWRGWGSCGRSGEPLGEPGVDGGALEDGEVVTARLDMSVMRGDVEVS